MLDIEKKSIMNRVRSIYTYQTSLDIFRVSCYIFEHWIGFYHLTIFYMFTSDIFIFSKQIMWEEVTLRSKFTHHGGEGLECFWR